MNKLLPLLLGLFSATVLHAQITVTGSDMPAPGKAYSIAVSSALGIQPGPGGANKLWNFSHLTATAHKVDTFHGMNTLSALVQAFFSGSGNMYVKSAAGFADTSGIAPISFGGADVIYHNTSTSFANTGLSVELGGMDLPVLFADADEFYLFPLQYNDRDSTTSHFVLQVPMMLYYESDSWRITEVDGWGTLITPSGTYSTLRLKSTVFTSDSFYMDSVGGGFRVPLQQTVEYQWLAKNQGVPLLSISGSMVAGSFVPTTVQYQDSSSIDTALTGIGRPMEAADLVVMPNPANDELHVELPSSHTGGRLLLLDMHGQVVLEKTAPQGTAGMRLQVSQMKPGNYLLVFYENHRRSVQQVLITR